MFDTVGDETESFIGEVVTITPAKEMLLTHTACIDRPLGPVIDNERGAKVPVIDDFDRSSNKRALRPFKQLFPGMIAHTIIDRLYWVYMS